jgi:hypothetical protein
VPTSEEKNMTTFTVEESNKSVSAEEITLRMKQGKRINETFERVYQDLLNADIPEPQARRRANAAAYEEACLLFRQIPGFESLDPVRDKKTLDAMMYDRKKVSAQLADFNIETLSSFPWAALQALGADAISKEYKMKILRLAQHYKDHPGCPNSLKPVILNFRHYCHQPDNEKLTEIDLKYARLLEELGETLDPSDIMLVQTERDKEITAQYEPEKVEEPMEEEVPEENIVQEAPEAASKSEALFPLFQQDAPTMPQPVPSIEISQPTLSIDAPVVPQPAPVETSHYASALSSFQGIIKTQSELIKQLQEQVTMLMALVSEAEAKEQRNLKQITEDYTDAMAEWENTQEKLSALELEFNEYKASHSIPNSEYEEVKQALDDLFNVRERISAALGI